MEKLNNLLPKSKWHWNDSFTYAKVIRWWGVWPPSKFFEASPEDQAFAFAAYEAEMTIQAWENHIANEKHRQDTANLGSDRDE